MKTVSHEYYVDLEVAKLLKDTGFDWECYELYEREYEQDGRVHAVTSANWNSSLKYYSAPSLDVAQRWLREVKDIDIYIFPTTTTKRECIYELGIKTFGRTLLIAGQLSTTKYDTYEKAQESGIKKALELILEKGK